MNNKDITLTPLEIINSLGSFDLDPCGFKNHNTADVIFTLPEKDGLKEEWFGKVWLNPPYSETLKWIKKMAKHNNGIACVLASTETGWFQDYVLKKANAIFFLKSRPKFLNDQLEVVNLMRGVVLVSYGDCIDYLKNCNLNGVLVDLSTALQITSNPSDLTFVSQKAINMGLEVQKSKISSPKLSPTEITSPNPNINELTDKYRKRGEK